MICPSCGRWMTLSASSYSGGPEKYRTEKVWACPSKHPSQRQVEEWAKAPAEQHQEVERGGAG